MKNYYLKPYWVLWLVLLCLCQTVRAQNFTHPGALIKQEDILRIKEKIQNQEEPYYSDYQAMISTEFASPDYWFREQNFVCRGGACRNIWWEEGQHYLWENYVILNRACAAANALAIRWLVTGDDQYAEAAIRGLNKWANTLVLTSGDTNKSLMTGTCGYQLATAAELLRDYEGWSEEDQGVFKDWLIDKFYLGGGGVQDFLNRHHDTCGEHYRSNWDAVNIAAAVAIGVYCDRQDIFDFGVNYLKDGIGNGNLKKLVWYVHPDGLAQTEEANRDQPHNIAAFGWISIAMEMAYNQGVDLWSYDNFRFLRGMEYTAKYNAGESVSNIPYRRCSSTFTEGASGGPSGHGRGQKRPVWELMFNHYAKRMGVATPYAQIIAENNRPEKGAGHFGNTSGGYDAFGYGTLMFFRDQEVPSAAPQGILTSQNGQSVVLSWIGSHGATGYEIKRADEQGGSYTTIGSTDSKTLYFTDQDLAIGPETTYYYQITAKGTPSGDLISEKILFEPALVNHFKFEGNVEDSQGNASPTTFGGPGYADGRIGQAIVFDGQDDYVQLPEKTYGFSDMTIATWVKWNGGGNWQRIFDFGPNNSQYMYLTPKSGQNTLAFGISTSKGAEGTEKLEADALPEGEWVHLAVTLNGEIGTLYVNGEPVSTLDNMKLKPRFPLTNSYIGKSQWPDPLYNGQIDDFRIYDYPLDGGDVWALARPGEAAAPHFVSNPIQMPNAVQDSLYDFSTLRDSVIVATTEDSLAFTKIGGPEWLGVTEEGFLSGTAGNDEVGDNQLVVQVKDSRGASDQAIFNIKVENVNDAPIWEADTVIKNGVVPLQPILDSLTAHVQDIDLGDVVSFSKISGPGWLSVSPEGQLTGTPAVSDEGINYFVIKATDQSNASTDAVISIEVFGSGLIAHYKFEGNVLDDQENYHANAIGTADYDSGVDGNGIHLSGGEHVLLPENITSILQSYTISTWVKLDQLDNWARIFDFGSSTSNYMFLTPSNGANGKIRFAIKTGGGEQRIDCNESFLSGVWTHLAVAYDGTSNTGILYVNGQEVGRNENMSLSPVDLGNTPQNYIGKSQWPDPNLKGYLDDFRIYNYGLSPEEIDAIYQAFELEPQITSSGELNANLYDTINYQITAQNNPSSFGAEGLPSGLEIDAETGLISGISQEDGVFDIKVSATNDVGTGSKNLKMNIFKLTIPGIIDMEKYNNGGSGIAYFDKSEGNAGGKYRTDDVDISYASNIDSYKIGWTDAGEWIKYTVEVSESKTYQARALVASGGSGGSFHIEINGTAATPTLTVPGTGGWNNWEEVTFDLDLEQGVHELTFFIDQGGFDIARLDLSGPDVSAGSPIFMNVHDQLDYTITATGHPSQYGAEGLPLGLELDTATGHISGSPSESGEFEVILSAENNNAIDYDTLTMHVFRHTLPGIVEMENFNAGGEGIAYHDNNSSNNGGAYRQEGVDIRYSSQAGSHAIGWNDPGEWQKYTLEVAQSGEYKVVMRTTSPNGGGPVHIEIDGEVATDPVQVPKSGSWDTWFDLPFYINLEEGVHEMTFHVDGSGADFDALRFYKTQEITFDSLPDKVIGDADFEVGATISSGLPLSYISSDETVAVVEEGQVHIVGAGTTEISVFQVGDELYAPSDTVIHSLTVLPLDLKVMHKDGDNGNRSNNSIKPHLQIVSESEINVAYEELTVRYWFTPENFAGISTWVDHAAMGKDKVSMQYIALDQPHQDAFGYVEYSFDPLADTLFAGDNSGIIQSRLNNQDWSEMDETNDYSYLSSLSFTENGNITLYRNGYLIWGEEPAEAASITDFKVYAFNKKGQNQINLNLKVVNEGNVPVNYEELKVRYWFTKEGTGDMMDVVDYAELGSENLYGQFVTMDPVAYQADHYYELGFDPVIGDLHPLSHTGEIMLRLHDANWSAMDQSNDYSYLENNQSGVNDHITVHYQGQLVFGTVPENGVMTSSESSEFNSSQESQEIVFYPNPTEGMLQYKANFIEGKEAELSVFNDKGKVMIEKQINSNEGSVDMSSLKSGVYVVQIFDGVHLIREKIIKK